MKLSADFIVLAPPPFEALVIREKVTGWLSDYFHAPGIRLLPFTARLQQLRADDFYEKSLTVIAFRS